MRMADRDRFPFFSGSSQSQCQLLSHCPYLRDIVEKRNITESRPHSGTLRSIVNHRRRGCPAANVKEWRLAQHGHQHFHWRRLRGALRALMVVGTTTTRAVSEES